MLRPDQKPCPHSTYLQKRGQNSKGEPVLLSSVQQFCDDECDHPGTCFGTKTKAEYEAELKQHRSWKKNKRKARR